MSVVRRRRLRGKGGRKGGREEGREGGREEVACKGLGTRRREEERDGRKEALGLLGRDPIIVRMEACTIVLRHIF